MIVDYLDSLAGALSFDRALSRCVLEEVEDHLREAVAADPAADRLEAERRAIANFGDPRAIAAQFAIVSLAKQTSRVGVAVILIVAGVFVAMKARVAWYAMTQWTIGDDWKAVGGIALSVDRFSFWLSLITGIVGFAYISTNRLRQAFDPAYRQQLTRTLFLCIAATATLTISVVGDGVLTTLQFLGAEWCIGCLVPLASMVIEVACAGILIFQVLGVAQRMASATAL